MNMKEKFEGTVLEENAFTVILSNAGDKKHANPNPPNLAKDELSCSYPTCQKTTRSIWSLCPEHYSKKKIHKHTADWLGIIRPSMKKIEQAKTKKIDESKIRLKAYASPHDEITECLLKWMFNEKDERNKITDNFVYECLANIVGKTPDATSLQRSLESGNGYHPTQLVDLVRCLVDEHLPASSHKNKFVQDIRLKLDKRIGEYYSEQTLMVDIPIRVIASQYALALACEEVNRGDLWFRKKKEYRPNATTRGGAYMPVVYYLLRRYTDASPKQARTCLK